MTYSNPQSMQNSYSFDNFRRRFTTIDGVKEAIDDSYVEPYRQLKENLKTPFGTTKDVENTIKNAPEGFKLPGSKFLREEGLNAPGSKFAGKVLAKGLENSGFTGKALRGVVNFIPGLNLIGDVFDVGEAVVGVIRGDEERQGQAKELAKQMAASGMSLDQAMTEIESNEELQDLAGNMGLDDWRKTLTYGAFTGGPSLNPIAAAAGLITGADLQREKSIRNRMFKEQFIKSQLNLS